MAALAANLPSGRRAERVAARSYDHTSPSRVKAGASALPIPLHIPMTMATLPARQGMACHRPVGHDYNKGPQATSCSASGPALRVEWGS